MIFVGIADEQIVGGIYILHIRAVHDLIRPVLGELLDKQRLADFDAEYDFFDEVNLTELNEQEFNQVYHLIMNHQGKDEWLDPIIPDLKLAFESDPRFQS